MDPPSPVPAPGLAVSQSVCLSCEPHAPLPTLSQGLPWEQRPQYIVLSAQMYGVRTGFLTWDQELQGVAGGRPHPGGVPVKAVASEHPPVPGGHRAHWEQGLGLPVGASLSIQCSRDLIFSFLGQKESVKSLMGATLEGHAPSQGHHRARQG